MSQMPATPPAAAPAAPPATPATPPAPQAAAPASANTVRPGGNAGVSIPSAFLKAPVRPPSKNTQPQTQQMPPILTPQGQQTGVQMISAPTTLNPFELRAQSQGQPMQPQGQQAPTPPAPPAPPAQTPPSQQQQDPYLLQMQQMQHTWDTERQAWQQREAQFQQALNQLMQERQAMTQQLQDYSFDNLFSEDELSKFESVDANDVKLIGKKMMQSMMGPLQQMGVQYQQQITQLNSIIKQQADEIQNMRQQTLTDAIVKAHPDFVQLQADPNFRAYLGQRNGLSAKTRDQAAAEEFLLGNAQYIIDMINQYKGMQPSQPQMMAVPPVQTPTQNMPVAPQPTGSQYTLEQLNQAFRLHRITPEQYTAELQKMRQAEAQQPPVAVNY